MRKLLVLLLLCLLCIPAFGAIPATMHWNVQSGGSAASTNAGGFDYGGSSCGTDESTGAGTAATFTIGGTTTQATSSPAFTSTTHGPCNTIIIASGAGCTTGTFSMTSQSAGTATFDRSLGTAASTCTGVIGGTKTLTSVLASGPTANGNTVDIKSNANYVLTSAIQIDATANLLLWGYQTTPGDSGTHPLITTATNSTILLKLNSPSQITIRNIDFSNTASTRADCIVSGANSSAHLVMQGTSSKIVVDGCGSTTGAAINGDNAANDAMTVELYNVEIKNGSNDGVRNWGAIGQSLAGPGTWIHDQVGWGWSLFGGGNYGLNVDHAVFSHNGTTSGGNLQGNNSAGCNLLIANSTFENPAHGPNINPSGCVLTVNNSILYGAVTYNIDAFAGTGYDAMESNNCIGGAGTANRNFTTYGEVIGDITLTADPATSSSNFVLNNTAGGGAVCKRAAFPGAGAAGTGTFDPGAINGSGSSGAGQTSSSYVQ